MEHMKEDFRSVSLGKFLFQNVILLPHLFLTLIVTAILEVLWVESKKPVSPQICTEHKQCHSSLLIDDKR